MNVGQKIRKQRESLGLSLRELENKIDRSVSRRNIRRFEENEFTSTTGQLEIVLDSLFTKKVDRTRLLGEVERMVSKNQDEIVDRREVRKAITQVSRKFFCRFKIVRNYMYGQPFGRMKDRQLLISSSYDVDMELYFRSKKTGERLLASILKKHFRFFDYENGQVTRKATLPSQQGKPLMLEGSAAAKKLRKLSNDLFGHGDAIFGFMQKAIQEEELFRFFSRQYFENTKGEKPILLQQQDISALKAEVEELYEAKNEVERKMAKERGISFIQSLQKRPDEILELQDALLRQVIFAQKSSF